MLCIMTLCRQPQAEQGSKVENWTAYLKPSAIEYNALLLSCVFASSSLSRHLCEGLLVAFCANRGEAFWTVADYDQHALTLKGSEGMDEVLRRVAHDVPSFKISGNE